MKSQTTQSPEKMFALNVSANHRYVDNCNFTLSNFFFKSKFHCYVVTTPRLWFGLVKGTRTTWAGLEKDHVLV